VKILHVIPYFYPAWRFGGSIKVAYDVSRKLVERGHSVTVYTTDILDEKTRVDDLYRNVEGVNVYYFKNLSLKAANRRMYFAPSLISAVSDNADSFDIVHIHGNRTTLTPILHYFLKKTSVPYVVQAHGGLPNLSRQRLKKLYDLFFGYNLLKDASKVIALTSVEAKQFESMGVPKSKIAIVPNGIDLSEFTDLQSQGSFKRKFGIHENKKIILYLGRIHKNKGIDFLVKAYAKMVKIMDLKETVLVIAGPDDGYLSEVRVLVNFLGISNSVFFTGLLSNEDKISAYVDASICAYLSRFEPFGIVTLEAAACGVPVIVCKETPMANIVDEGKFGFSVKHGDINKLAEIVRNLLNDDKILGELSQAGRGFVFRNFDWADKVAKLEQVYNGVVNKNQ
jgi:glycosyltransferase involved in cell wall biosynthesis